MTCERKHVRGQIVWSPQWNAEYQGWAAKYIRENKWRVDPVHDFDDLMQNAWMLFNHLAATYPRVLNDRQFMGLFKRAMINKFNDYSCYKRRRAEGMPIVSGDVTEIVSGRIGEQSNAGYIAALIDEMPGDLKLALDLLSKGVAHKKPVRRAGRRMEKRDNLSHRICRAFGLPKRHDPVSDLKQLLTI